MRIFIKKLLPLLIATIVVIISFGQSSNNNLPKIDPELLKQDFIFFRDSLQQLHAGLYRYRSKKEIDKLFDSCFATLKHPINAVVRGHQRHRRPRRRHCHQESGHRMPGLRRRHPDHQPRVRARPRPRPERGIRRPVAAHAAAAAVGRRIAPPPGRWRPGR